MLDSTDGYCHYSHNATGVAGGSLIPLIHCRNLYTDESVCSGHKFHACFLPSKGKATREGNLTFF